VISDVLMDYCENNIASDKREKQRVEEAWKTILKENEK